MASFRAGEVRVGSSSVAGGSMRWLRFERNGKDGSRYVAFRIKDGRWWRRTWPGPWRLKDEAGIW